MRPYADLFFMGAAFLLLETKNITSFALLFGTTWVVNAIVFAGVLDRGAARGGDDASVANTAPARRLRRHRGRLAGRLRRAELRAARARRCARWSWRVALAFAPIYLANVAFAKRFATTEDSRRRSPSTSSARWSAAAWNTSRCSPDTATC